MGNAIAHGAGAQHSHGTNGIRIQVLLPPIRGLCELAFGIAKLAAEFPDALVANSDTFVSPKGSEKGFIRKPSTKTASLDCPHSIDLLLAEMCLDPTGRRAGIDTLGLGFGSLDRLAS